MKNQVKIIAIVLMVVILACSLVACDDSSLTVYDIAGLQSSIQELKDQITAQDEKINSLISENQGLKDTINEQSQKIDGQSEEIDAQASLIQELSYEGPVEYGQESYDKVVYIDKLLSDRDCIAGENFKLTQKWIHTTLLQAGYSESDIVYQDVEIAPRRGYFLAEDANLDTALCALKSYSVSETKYSKSGKTYVEDAESGTFVKIENMISQNIIVTKKGNTDKQIIIGMHYDGTGTGDNGSGIALGLTTAEKFANIETEYTLVFVFFTGEEYGMFGSKIYANSLTETEIANTLYMINMDSLVCGDYAYLYGGVQDNENDVVTKTEAYDNAMEIAAELGLSFKSNPWSWENKSPDDVDEEDPSYATPSTGNWSDHVYFKQIGITYLYMEATNWEIPDYTGYGETYLVGMLMNTENDYLEYIETYFPGRILNHLTQFSTLLNALLMQNDYQA